jgi:hypothetical protein
MMKITAMVVDIFDRQAPPSARTYISAYPTMVVEFAIRVPDKEDTDFYHIFLTMNNCEDKFLRGARIRG